MVSGVEGFGHTWFRGPGFRGFKFWDWGLALEQCRGWGLSCQGVELLLLLPLLQLLLLLLCLLLFVLL